MKKIIKFRNKKGSKIFIEYVDVDEVIISVYWDKGNIRYDRYEDMPITRCSLVATFWDYEEILKRVLKDDKVARRWFRRNVKPIIIDENGLTLGDFILPNDIVDYEKARKHDRMILGLEDK